MLISSLLASAKSTANGAARKALAARRIEIRRIGLSADQERRRRDVVALTAALARAEGLHLPSSARRTEMLTRLVGTDPSEGLHIIHGLHDAIGATDGAVCEFGVAQGATSALLASELVAVGQDRPLWLYDSFDGLPAPTSKDRLIDDIFGLGSMEAYAGSMSVPEYQVRQRLAELEFTNFEVVRGFFTSDTTTGPPRIAFAFIDFDLYQPIVDGLAFVHSRSGPGAVVIVDDYGYFSSGAATAVNEFCEQHDEEWKLTVIDPSYGHFAVLGRR